MGHRLEDILAPLGADAFFADYAGRRPAHLTGVPARRALPGWPELAELLNMSAVWSADTLIVLHQGETVAAARYCEPATDRDLQPTQRPIAERVLALQAAGAVVVARQVETLAPALKRIAADLETGFGAHVTGDLHLHRTAKPPPTAAVATSDLLVLVLSGAAEIEVRAGAIEHPVPHPKFAGPDSATPVGAPILTARLAAGERLYVPRGVIHTLVGADADTAFVVFTIARPGGLELLHALTELALDEPFFRAGLPRAEADRDAYLAEFGSRFAALAAGPRGIAATLQLERGFQRDLTDYTLPAGGPSAHARYRRNASRLEVVETPEGWQLRAARGAVPIPVGRERLVAWIVARAEFSDDELGAAFPDAGPEVVATLLRDLAAMKVIVTAS
ncbi:MAG: hypothetical protein HY060_00955 [Proteobacteria bacterium]|nr:hypothetical protein [Pseudomonadota bacterium]